MFCIKLTIFPSVFPVFVTFLYWNLLSFIISTCSLINMAFCFRFSPEMLGIQASSALAWMVVEIVVELITLYITNIQTNLKTLDLMAYGGYKYVG